MYVRGCGSGRPFQTCVATAQCRNFRVDRLKPLTTHTLHTHTYTARKDGPRGSGNLPLIWPMEPYPPGRNFAGRVQKQKRKTSPMTLCICRITCSSVRDGCLTI